jgi:hypothetical protein
MLSLLIGWTELNPVNGYKAFFLPGNRRGQFFSVEESPYRTSLDY